MRNCWWGAVAALLWFGLLPATAQRKSDPSTAFRTDPLALALQHDSVYVDKTLRGQVDAKALRTMAAKAPADRPVKLAVVKMLPVSGKSFGNRDTYTRALHKYLKMGRGTLMIVTDKGVSASTNALAPERITAVLKQDAAAIRDNAVSGLDRALTDLYDAMDNRSGAVSPGAGYLGKAQFTGSGSQSDGIGGFPLFLLLPVGAFLIFTVGIFGAIFGLFGQKGYKQAMRQATLSVERLRGEVVNGLAYADTYLELLPASSELAANRQLRQNTAALYEQAKAVAQAARQPQDFGRAEALLEQANQNVVALKQFIDRATGGTGFAVAVEGTDYRVTPVTANGATLAAPVLTGLNPADIPPAERAACFFCSRPARISDLTPVTIALNGQRRKVLACADDIRTVQQGATPQVRTILEGDRQGIRLTPWYHAPSYDPYRDYSHTQAVYHPAYSTVSYDPNYNHSYGVWDDLLLGSLFYQPMPFAYPVFIGNDGYATNEPFAAAPPLLMQDNYSGGDNSNDFFSGNSGFDSGGSADFGGGQDSGGGADYSSSDTGTDFGGSSDAGFDSGGSADFGGGDSGGGSDFGGGGDSGGSGDSGGGGGDS